MFPWTGDGICIRVALPTTRWPRLAQALRSVTVMSKSIIACAFARGLYSFWEGVSAISARSYPRTNWFSTYTMLTLARIGLIDERGSSAQHWYLSTFFGLLLLKRKCGFNWLFIFAPCWLSNQPTDWKWSWTLQLHQVLYAKQYAKQPVRTSECILFNDDKLLVDKVIFVTEYATTKRCIAFGYTSANQVSN